MEIAGLLLLRIRSTSFRVADRCGRKLFEARGQEGKRRRILWVSVLELSMEDRL
jgi:hypothetical protein